MNMYSERGGFIMKRLLALLLALALMLPVCAALAEIPAAVVTDRVLHMDRYGDDVKAAQQRLAYYGYYAGKIDGVFGSEMSKAVFAFQRANGLKADGKIGPKTLAVLNSSTAVNKKDASSTAGAGTIQYGNSGEAVKELQRQLRETYYYAGTIDGIFGAEVNRAVKAFQASARLTADGKVGPSTKNALYNRAAAIFNGGIPVRALAQGDRGWDVYVLQQKLASLNYLSSYTAGVFDADTVAGVKKFQTANKLEADGKAASTLRRYLWPTTVNQEEENANAQKGTADDPYTERVLKKGRAGADVASAQMRLKAAGFLLGNADGIFGETTEKAVKALQKHYGLKQDGIIGPKTWAVIKTLNVSNAEQTVVDNTKPAVGPSVTKLHRGSRGAAVTKLQQQLINLGYLSAGSDDGKFGPLTAVAVMEFQKDQGIAVDGVVGTQTYVKINEALGIQTDGSVG